MNNEVEIIWAEKCYKEYISNYVIVNYDHIAYDLLVEWRPDIPKLAIYYNSENIPSEEIREKIEKRLEEYEIITY